MWNSAVVADAFERESQFLKDPLRGGIFCEREGDKFLQSQLRKCLRDGSLAKFSVQMPFTPIR